MKRSLLFFTAIVALLGAASGAEARDQIKIVGSSTVYPFTTAVAESFGKVGTFPTPVVESTGTGGGFKAFCAGVGPDFPDFTNASRAIKASEFQDCQKNGVTGIVELKIGFDGIVLANAKAGPDLTLTKDQIFRALAKEIVVDGKLTANPNKTWKDVDASLPDEKIEVLGPPPTSGTRDAFLELVMEKGGEANEMLAKMKTDDAKAFEKVWKSIREDGAYIDAGENDNLIVQKLEANPEAVGIFGFSFLEENTAKIKGAKVEGVAPEFEAIAAGDYKVSRPLFVYVKKQHIGVIPGIAEFIAEYTSEKAMGEEGYLANKGLIPLPADMAQQTMAAGKDLTVLTEVK
ncbi:MAG: PstS family phosphate ABC transporter substrate-binding protein [Hyphomicrobiaceae bacterium]